MSETGTDRKTLTIPVGTTLKEAERLLVAATLEACGGNKKTAAKVLGISRTSLYAKLAKVTPAAQGPGGASPPAAPSVPQGSAEPTPGTPAGSGSEAGPPA